MAASFAHATVLWIDKIYVETMDLLEEAKHYHANRFRRQVDHLMPIERLEITKECLRVTSRLSHTMAWLLSEKAILAEEVEREEIEQKQRPLLEEDICTRPNNYDIEGCPSGLISLMERSLNLFMRVVRLEKMLRT